jgi:hypothetical protein
MGEIAYANSLSRQLGDAFLSASVLLPEQLDVVSELRGIVGVVCAQSSLALVAKLICLELRLSHDREGTGHFVPSAFDLNNNCQPLPVPGLAAVSGATQVHALPLSLTVSPFLYLRPLLHVPHHIMRLPTSSSIARRTAAPIFSSVSRMLDSVT